MNEYERTRYDCCVGAKAFQNIRASHAAFERLCGIVNSDDHVLLSGLFHVAVVRYAKPFIESKTPTGVVKYPTKHLKKVEGFSQDLHEHLLLLRNTLIAHDDFNKIAPRPVLTGLQPADLEFFIPVRAVVSNKCISHPADLPGAIKMTAHVKATLGGVAKKLYEDLGTMRKVALEKPEQAKAAQQYSRNFGPVTVGAGGSHLTHPDLTDDPYLNVPEPDFSDVHGGYRYEALTIDRKFHGPERITLPDGSSVEIKPRDAS